MIDCLYTAESRLKELALDAILADLWFQKECGGRKRLRNLMDRMSKRVSSENRTLVSNVCEFQSPRRNRWLVYLQVTPEVVCNCYFCVQNFFDQIENYHSN